MNERDSHLSSRRAFLGKSALAGGAIAGGALALSGLALPAHALEFSYGDSRLLAFLLEVQTLQSEFFTRAALTMTAEGLTEGEANALNTFALQDERQKRWCKLALRKFGSGQNGWPSTMSGGFTRSRYSFGAMNSRDALLRESLRLKSAGAAAWMGAAGQADKGEVAAAFASLAGVQARHRALLASSLEQPALMAMAPTMTMRQAMRELEQFGFSASM